VQVPYNEGLANHVVPESCAVCRETCGEALTGVRAGQPLSRDSLIVPSADAVDTAEGNTTERDNCEHSVGSAWSKTLARTHAPCSGTGRSPVWPVAAWAGPHREGEEP
jgi:hypothetical protein